MGADRLGSTTHPVRPPVPLRARKVFAAAGLSAVLSVTAFVGSKAFRSDPLPVGAPIPRLEYRSADTSRLLAPTSTGQTLVILYSPSCEHCRAELDAFERSVDRTRSIRMIIIAAAGPNSLDLDVRWPRLRTASNVTWGQAALADLRSKFGVSAVPAIYLFSADGSLRKKFRGETKISLLFPTG